METSGIFRRCQISIEKLEARTHFTTALWSFLQEIVQDRTADSIQFKCQNMKLFCPNVQLLVIFNKYLQVRESAGSFCSYSCCSEVKNSSLYAFYALVLYVNYKI